jgi:plasmid rolling circle replication initiator protein Rep
MHYESLKKQNNDSEPMRARNYSVLSNSNANLHRNSKVTVNEGNNPYFPHIIRQAYDQSMSTRFTGNRNWNHDPSPSTHLPDPRSEYISRWVRI